MTRRTLASVGHVVLEKLPRNAAMDGVDLFRRLDPPGGKTLIGEQERIDAVLGEVKSNLLADLAVPSTVRGWRAQALFASLVAALDECELMTFVDTGDVYYDGPSVKPPDYFLCLRSGKKILVDVKAVELRSEDPLEMPIKFGAAEVDRMRRFGDLFGAEVFLAFYYPMMPLWSLIPLSELVAGPGGGYRMTVKESILRNQIALLGDLAIGTLPSLECIIRPDTSQPHVVDGSGELTFAVGSIEYRLDGSLVTSDEGRRVLNFLMLYGGWEDIEEPVLNGDELVELRFTARPPEDTGQGFEIVGSLSSMYSRMFESSTSSSLGITALDMPIAPGSLISLIPHDYDVPDMPLWRLHLSPAPDTAD
jgi:hypothetical protein